VRLRPYTFDDTERHFEAVRESMAELLPWIPWCKPGYSLDDARTWIAMQIHDFAHATSFEFVVEDETGRLIGGCCLNKIDRANRRANLGYWIRTSAAGRGMASEAVRRVRDWGFAETDLIRLELFIAVDNTASLRVAEKAGARYEGTLRHRFFHDGRPQDATIWAFTRD
jgi:ribosomal-protein-serine acetyltransferase